jgi:farnesyl diphosphate synthase
MRYAVLDGGKRLRPAAGAGGLRGRARQRARGPARRLRRRTDPRLFAGARRHAVHGQRRPAPRQAHGARAVRRGDARCWPATRCRRWPSSCWRPTTPHPRRVQARLCRCWRGRGPRRHGRRPGHRPGQRRQAADRGPAAPHAPPEDRRAAAGQRDDGRGLRRQAARRQAGLADYGRALGLAFQVVDDILDVTADSATLGKTAGKDAAAGQADLRLAAGAGPRARACPGTAAQARAALATSGLADTARCWRWPRWSSTATTEKPRMKMSLLETINDPADLRRLPRAAAGRWPRNCAPTCSTRVARPAAT